MLRQLTKIVFTKQPNFRLLINSRTFTAKYLREQQIKKESKWQSIRETIFDKYHQTNGNMNWNQLVSELVEQRLVFKQNFEVELMSAFNLSNDYDSHRVDRKLFRSLMDFIKGLPNISTNSIAASRYCQFVSEFPQYIDEATIQLIRDTTDKLMDKYSERKVAFEVAYDCLMALAKSSKDNCLHAIELLPRLNRTNDKIMNSIIDSSLKFKLFDHSFSLINTNTDFKLSRECISNCVSAILESNMSFEQTINLFNTFSKTLIVFDITLESKFKKIMNRFGYEAVRAYVEPSGLCHSCDQTLRGLTLEEHSTLRDALRATVFNKEENLLLASFAEYQRELNNFDRFMRKLTAKKPLDLVVDGLNIAYRTSGEFIEDKRKLRSFVKVYNKNDIDEQLVEILFRNNVLDNYENVLIIGRKHMQNWPRLNALMNRASGRISIFYAMNKTKDDTYILYAAVQDPKTNIISSDFYRDYLDKMAKKNMATLFQRWLRSHQILVGERKYIELPDQYDYRIHLSKDNTTIHIPFSSFDTDRNEELIWICCRKKD